MRQSAFIVHCTSQHGGQTESLQDRDYGGQLLELVEARCCKEYYRPATAAPVKRSLHLRQNVFALTYEPCDTHCGNVCSQFALMDVCGERHAALELSVDMHPICPLQSRAKQSSGSYGFIHVLKLIRRNVMPSPFPTRCRRALRYHRV